MKKVILLLIGLMTFNMAMSQDFEKGGNYITLGYGFDPYFRANVYNAGYGHKQTSLGPIILAYERGITDVLGIGRIGVGGAIGQSFYTSKSNWNSNHDIYEYKTTSSRTSIAFRAAYHFEFGVDKMDVYAGIGGALHIITDSYKTNNPNDSGYGYKSNSVSGGPSLFGGIRYYFTNSFGVYAEVGYDISAVNGGMVFKF